MALNSNLGLGFHFTARDAASGTIRKIGRSIRNLAGQVFTGANLMRLGAIGIGASAATAGAGVLGLAASFKLASSFGEFEQGVANVGATMGATIPEMKALGDAAKQAGIDTQFSPTEATQGLESLAAAGQGAADAISTLNPVLQLAAGSKGQLGLAESAEAVVGTLKSYGLAADQAASVTDKLLTVTNASNFQARDFAGGLAKAASMGSLFNQDLTTVLATMGFVRDANIDASSAATGFGEALRRLGTDQKAQTAVTDLGVDIFDKQTGAMRQLPDIMFDFAEATKGMKDEEKLRLVVQAFGVRGMKVFGGVLKAQQLVMKDGIKTTVKGSEAWAAFKDKLDNSAGAAKTMTDRLLDTFEGQKTLLQGTLQTLAVTLGEGFAGVLRPIVTGITTVLNFFIKAISAIPAPAKKMLAGLILGSSAFLTLAGVMGIVLFLFVLMLPMLGTLIAVFALAVFALAPLIGAFAFVAAAISGFRKAIDANIGGIGDFFAKNFGRAKTAALALFQFFSEGKISGAIAEDLSKDAPLFNFVDKVVALGQRIGNFFKGFGKGFRNILVEMEPVFDSFMEAIQRLGEALGILSPLSDGAKSAFEKFGDSGESMGQKMGIVFSKIVESITSMINQVIDNKDVFINLADNVGKAFTEAGKLFGAITGADLSGSTGDIDGLGKSVIEMGRAFEFAFKWIANTIRGMRVFARAMELQERPEIGIAQAFALARDEIVNGNEALVARQLLLKREKARVEGDLPRELNKSLRGFKSEDLLPPELQLSVQPVEAVPTLVSFEPAPGGVGPAELEPTAGIVILKEVTIDLPPLPPIGPVDVSTGGLPAELISALGTRPPPPNVSVNVTLDGEEIASKLSTTLDDAPGGASTGA